MESTTFKNVLVVTRLLLILKGVQIAKASPVSQEVNIPSCHYKSNGSCITEVTLIVSSDETEKLSFSIDYQLPNNGDQRRAAECGWTLGKFTCLTERGYSYTPPVNGTFHLSIDLSIHCVNGVTFSVTLYQRKTIVCNLQQDLNRTSGDGKCNETVHSSNALLIGISIAIVLTIVILAVVAWCCRENLKQYCCSRFNKKGTPKRQTEDIQDSSLKFPLKESNNQQTDQESSDAC